MIRLSITVFQSVLFISPLTCTNQEHVVVRLKLLRMMFFPSRPPKSPHRNVLVVFLQVLVGSREAHLHIFFSNVH